MTLSQMIVGIDLGTSNSLIGYFDEEPKLIPNINGSFLTPSVVGLSDKGEVLVGAAAKDRLVTHPDLTASVFKRAMGSPKLFQLGRKAFRPEELSSLVLKSLKADAERHLGVSVERAIITVPAYFRDAQRKATIAAGEMAGFKVERLINEPTAAALAFGLNQTDEERKILVLDLGGGTFDVSILHYFEGITEVRATAGDNYLGGEDYTQEIVSHIKATNRHPETTATSADGKLVSLADKIKSGLSEKSEISMSYDYDGKTYSYTLTRSKFEEITQKHTRRLEKPLEVALRDTSLRVRDIDEIVLVGGATRMKVVKDLVGRLFGRFPPYHVSPDEAVALGATIQAGLKMKAKEVTDTVLTDVSPFTLGVGIAEMIGSVRDHDVMSPIIERNTVIPASRVQTLTTLVDNQRSILLTIYQGESRKASSNVSLGKIEVPVPKGRAGEELVDVRFTYDINGVLEVEATVLSNLKKMQLIIEENPGVLSTEEIQASLKKLSKLKILPIDEVPNKTLIARLERMFEESLGVRRTYVGSLLGRFNVALSTQNPTEISRIRLEIEGELQAYDDDPFGIE